MQAIKKVFSHGDSDNTSPSGHFNTASDEYDTSKSAQHSTNTPNHAAPSAPAKAVEKMAGVDPSHAAGSLSDSNARSGNHHETGTHVVGSRDTSAHQNPASSTSNGLDNERSSTGHTGTNSGSQGGLMEKAKEAVTGNSSSHNTNNTENTLGNSSRSHDNTLGGSSHHNDSTLGGSSRHTGAESTSRGGVVGAAEQALGSNHSHNHPKEHTHLDQEHARDATHDHKHLAAVTHEKHQVHETEEVTRQREVDRHVHHVQHHVQPVHDTQHAEKVHHEQIHPVSHIQEKHVSTEEDKHALAGLNKHHDSVEHAAKDRVVVDKGEIVNENTTHHVHHVVQPVIERDTHEHHTIHTTIPTEHVVHEAPVVHASVEHEPMHLKDFVKGGGDLKSKLTHDSAGILSEGNDCVRKTDGPAEGLLEKLHLSSNNHTNASTGAAGQQGINSTSTGTHSLSSHGNQGLGQNDGLNSSSTGTHGLSSHGNQGLTGQNEGLTSGSHGLGSGSHISPSGHTGSSAQADGRAF